jgi:hypothetical protein
LDSFQLSLFRDLVVASIVVPTIAGNPLAANYGRSKAESRGNIADQVAINAAVATDRTARAVLGEVSHFPAFVAFEPGLASVFLVTLKAVELANQTGLRPAEDDWGYHSCDSTG